MRQFTSFITLSICLFLLGSCTVQDHIAPPSTCRLASVMTKLDYKIWPDKPKEIIQIDGKSVEFTDYLSSSYQYNNQGQLVAYTIKPLELSFTGYSATLEYKTDSIIETRNLETGFTNVHTYPTTPSSSPNPNEKIEYTSNGYISKRTFSYLKDKTVYTDGLSITVYENGNLAESSYEEPQNGIKNVITYTYIMNMPNVPNPIPYEGKGNANLIHQSQLVTAYGGVYTTWYSYEFNEQNMVKRQYVTEEQKEASGSTTRSYQVRDFTYTCQ